MNSTAGCQSIPLLVVFQAKWLLRGLRGRKYCRGPDWLHWWSFRAAQPGSGGPLPAQWPEEGVLPDTGQGPWTQSPHHLLHTGRTLYPETLRIFSILETGELVKTWPLYFSASGGGDGGVSVRLRPGARTRLWDHSSEKVAAWWEVAEWGVPTLHGAHEEPMGDDRLDGCLESGVRAIWTLAPCATCPTAEYIIHFVGALGIKPLLTFNFNISLFPYNFFWTFAAIAYNILQLFWNDFYQLLESLHKETSAIHIIKFWKWPKWANKGFQKLKHLSHLCCHWHYCPCSPPAGHSSGNRGAVQIGRSWASLFEMLGSFGKC